MKKFINDLTLSEFHPKVINWCKNNFPDDTSFDLMFKQVLPHLSRFDRKSVKKTVMCCTNYGATMMTAFNDMREMLHDVFMVVDQSAQGFILRVLYYSMEGAYQAQVNYQKFAKKIFTHQSKVEGCTRWFSPLTNLPVFLKVNKEEEHKVAYFDIRSRKTHRAVLRKKTDAINTLKMGSTSIPSYIHSTDAAILIETAGNVCGEFMPLHDAFGVLCNDTADLTTTVNKAMYDISQGDYLNKLKEEVAPLLEIEVPSVGDWDPKEVLIATHAFT